MSENNKETDTLEDLRLIMEDSPDSLIDLEKGIQEVLSSKERKIMVAKISGYNYLDLGVTKKFWSYHLSNSVKKLKEFLTE